MRYFLLLLYLSFISFLSCTFGFLAFSSNGFADDCSCIIFLLVGGRTMLRASASGRRRSARPPRRPPTLAPAGTRLGCSTCWQTSARFPFRLGWVLFCSLFFVFCLVLSCLVFFFFFFFFFSSSWSCFLSLSRSLYRYTLFHLLTLLPPPPPRRPPAQSFTCVSSALRIASTPTPSLSALILTRTMTAKGRRVRGHGGGGGEMFSSLACLFFHSLVATYF